MGKNTVLIWDFDGTIGYREDNWEGAIIEILNKYFPNSESHFDVISKELNRGFPWHQSSKYYPELRDANKWWNSANKVFKRIFLSIGFSETDANLLSEKVRLQYLSEDKWKLYDDSFIVLSALSKLGFQQYLISNHIPELPDILLKLKIRSYFKELFISSLVGYNKPNPKIITESSPDLLSSNKNVVVIGDRYESDILLAKEINRPGILVRNYDARAPIFFQNLNDLEKYLINTYL